jgi:hypothetical protein
MHQLVRVSLAQFLSERLTTLSMSIQTDRQDTSEGVPYTHYRRGSSTSVMTLNSLVGAPLRVSNWTRWTKVSDMLSSKRSWVSLLRGDRYSWRHILYQLPVVFVFHTKVRTSFSFSFYNSTPNSPVVAHSQLKHRRSCTDIMIAKSTYFVACVDENPTCGSTRRHVS